MISYHFYKVLHIAMILFLISTLGFLLNDHLRSKGQKILVGVVSFLIFVGGMGLIARMGFRHGEPFPLWINVKILMWVLINISLLMIGRIPRNYRKWLYVLVMFLTMVAVYMAINKPLLN